MGATWTSLTQVIVGLGAIAGVVALAMRPLRQALDRLEKDMAGLATAVAAQDQREKALIGAIVEVLPHLQPRQDDAAARGFDGFRIGLMRMLVPAVRTERDMGNPLKPEEVDRLDRYRAILGDRVLTPEEAGDLSDLVKRMADSHPSDTSLAGLVVMAAMMVAVAALVAASRQPR